MGIIFLSSKWYVGQGATPCCQKMAAVTEQQLEHTDTHDPLCLQDNHGAIDSAGVKIGQLLEVKVERYKQPVILK